MTLTKPRATVAALAALAVAAAWAPLAASSAHAAELTDQVQFTTGHIDAFNLALNEDDTIRLNLKEDVTGSHVQRAPESVELVVKKEAHRENLPAGYLPPGAPTTLWFLPMTQDPDLIWPGWDSMGIASAYGMDATVSITISAVDGPGEVYLWASNPFGAPVQLLTDSWKLPATIQQSYLAHVHANWGFTEPGTYTLTAQATATSKDGSRTSTSNTADYTFVVKPVAEPEPEPEPSPTPDPEPGDTTLSISGVAGHYHAGGVATLTAVQSPEPVSDHFHWFARGSEELPWVVVNGASTESYGFVVTESMQVKAVLYDHDHQVIAESDPANIVVDDHGNTPGFGPEIDVTLPAEQGALTISVSDEGKSSTLSDLTLNGAADRYVSEGSITGITVTDTRPGAPGWTANGRVRGLVTVDGAQLPGKYLGWTPKVVSASDGQTVTAGDQVMPGFAEGTGIQGWTKLGSAPAGASTGTAVLGANLRIEAPTTTAPGRYRGLVLITVI
jgi:surface-anchored protein